jgi:hypothetical protein
MSAITFAPKEEKLGGGAKDDERGQRPFSLE